MPTHRTRWAWITATFFGIGHLRPGPGTYASVATILLWYFGAKIFFHPVDFSTMHGYSGIQEMREDMRKPAAPQISFGPPGSFDAGSLRDNVVWFARGKYWTLYTGAQTGTAPYYPSIGIATCDPAVQPHSGSGCPLGGWVKRGQVIVPNPLVSACAGAVFSPGLWYSAATDELWVYPSCTQSPEQWYSGPITIAAMKAARGADWTAPASYAWQNGGNPVLIPDQPWEHWALHSQGVYAPDVQYIHGQYLMFYSASGTSRPLTYQWLVGIAHAPSPAGPWTKTGVPVTGAHSNLEEPAVAQLPHGGLIMFTDQEGGGISGAAHAINILATNDPTGLTGWTEVEDLHWPLTAPFNAGHIESPTITPMPNGQWLLGTNAWDGDPHNDHRTLEFATLRFSSFPSLVFLTAALALLATLLGIPAATIVARESGRKDPGHVVIDEVAGQLVALIALSPTWPHAVLALLLFRLFDILKPPPIRQLEKLPGGTGIMLDDLAAGLLAALSAHLIIFLRYR